MASWLYYLLVAGLFVLLMRFGCGAHVMGRSPKRQPPDMWAASPGEAGLSVPAHVSRPARLPVVALGMSLGLFLALTFVACVGFDLLFPAQAMAKVWMPLLPGFTWLSWGSFLLGVLESVAYGWYVALIVGPLYNYFSSAMAG